jgi:hypothetical protein
MFYVWLSLVLLFCLLLFLLQPEQLRFIKENERRGTKSTNTV